MIEVNKTKWDKLDDEKKISYCKDNLVDPAMEERRKNDWDWYVNQMFLDGNHYIYFNTATNTIENVPRVRNKIRLTINLTKATIRAIQNYTTRFHPKWEVIPGDTDEETIVMARRSGKFLDYSYRKLNIRSKIRKLVRSGLATGVGWWEVGWDESLADGKGDVYVDYQDPFDIFLPKTAYLDGSSVVRSPYIAKVVARHIEEIKNDDRYDEKSRKKVVPDDDMAKSEYKRRILRKHGYRDKRDEGSKTALVYEVMLYDSEGNSKGGNVNIFTFAGNQVLRDEETEMTEFPLYLYRPDDSDNRIYTTPLVTDLMPINKVLNRLESQIVEYCNQTSKFRLIAEKGHGANLVGVGRSGNTAEVLEVSPGRQFEQFNSHPLPMTIHREVDSLNNYFSDVSGAHPASLGSSPTGARSAKQLEVLQSADSNNLSGMRESLEDFLSVVGKRILNIASEKYVASRVIKITEPENKQNYMKVVGENANINLEDGLVIKGDNEVIVNIGSWLGHTRDAQRETMVELKKLGILDAGTVLKYFEFGNIEEIAEKAREERLEEHKLKAEIAGRREQQAGETGIGPSMPDVRLADEENARMMNGEQLPPTPNATPQHTQGHLDFLESPDVQANPQAQQIIAMHAQGELEQQTPR